jgi:dTDP-4-amino-4,6-dideoxygalactose transaminase
MAEMATRIPLVDLAAQQREIAEEIEQGWADVIDRGAFILGDEVEAFEREFAAFMGVEHCVGVASGTDALELALRAVGVAFGDEVLLPANTFIATALAVRRIGAVPALVDCAADSQLLDVEQAGARVSPRTRAIVPVHLFGQLAPMEKVSALAQAHDLAVVEDAAQSQGATRHGLGGGAFGDAAGSSFYPGKNLGAYGDAGAVLSVQDDVDGRVRALRNYGSEVKYHHPVEGFNSRLDTLQAVVLRAKLARLAGWNEARREAAARYDERLAGVEAVARPAMLAGNVHVWHLYVVRVPNRDAVLESLHAHGIMAGIHYPVPIHLQGAFADLGHGPGDFPETEAAASRNLSLPIFPEITEAQQDRVCERLLAALSR